MARRFGYRSVCVWSDSALASNHPTLLGLALTGACWLVKGFIQIHVGRNRELIEAEQQTSRLNLDLLFQRSWTSIAPSLATLILFLASGSFPFQRNDASQDRAENFSRG
jgi:hypothetical protein